MSSLIFLLAFYLLSSSCQATTALLLQERHKHTYIGAYSNQSGGTIITFLLSYIFAKILFSILFQIYWTLLLCSCVVGRWKQYGGHHGSYLGGCRAVVQRSPYDSSPVKCLEVSLFT